MKCKKNAPVYLQIELLPLQVFQIRAELRRIGYKDPGALPLLIALKTDSKLNQVIKTPIYFNILYLIFARGKRLTDLNLSTKNLHHEIVSRFVNEVLTLYSQPKARLWLSFLASRMSRENLVVFELRDLQYNWWTWNTTVRLVSRLVHALVYGLAFGLVYGLIGGLVFGLTFNLFGGLIGTLIGSLIYSLAYGLIYDLVHTLNEIYSNYFQIKKPYQRFFASMKILHFSILRHFHLRYLLYKRDLLPMKLVHFLNDMTDRHILESDGATWRFRHRIIQDYFAEIWNEKFKEDLEKDYND